VDVDERGTEAAAATSMATLGASPAKPLPRPLDFRVDRPFLFLLRDRPTDTILFMGGSSTRGSDARPAGPAPLGSPDLRRPPARVPCRPVLPDDQAERIEAGLGSADRATLARWARLLLDDRRARTALLLGRTRRPSYARKRLAQAFAYMDGLLRTAEEEAKAPWPGRLPCPHCGAPAVVVKAEQRTLGHAIVHAHADGVRCEGPGGRRA